MNLSREEARQSLQDIEQVISHTRKTLNAVGGDLFMILWGMIWIIGFLTTHFAWRIVFISWPVLDLIGLVGTAAIAYKNFRNFPVKGPAGATIGRNIGLCWMFIILYGHLFVIYLRPTGWAIASNEEAIRLTAFGCTLIMFAYIGMGLIIPLKLRENYLIGVGVLVTVMVFIGYFFMRPIFFLWVGLTGGGALFLSGIYLALRYRWRR